MTKENFDVSKDGFKTSLLTFISGHATSLIVVAFLVTAYYFPVFDTPLKIFKNFSLSTENKVFIVFLVFLLLHPFGLFTDVLGWMLFGWMEKYFETFHFKRKTFLTQGTKNYLCFETLKRELQLTADNFYEQARQKEYDLITKHPDIMGELDFSLGSSIFFRNLTVCSIVIAMIYFSLGHILTGLIVLFISILFVIINSCVSFYYSLSILMFFSKFSNQKE